MHVLLFSLDESLVLRKLGWGILPPMKKIGSDILFEFQTKIHERNKNKTNIIK